MIKKISFLFFLLMTVCHNCIYSQNKQIMSTSYTKDFLKEKLVDFDKFSPVPKYKDSYWQDSIPENMRLSYIKEAEKYIGTKWESLNIILFSEFRENGGRDKYQNFLFSKRNKLLALAMGEIMEGKGRFINDILNGMFSVCEETWWGVHAHYSPKMPVPELQTLALFSGETGGMMAWMYYMFKEPIREFSPLLEKRILSEISRRVLEEAANKREWWRTASMNWNPWICSNWLACILFAEPDREKQIEYLGLVFESLDSFIDGYPEDGGCDEGAHYWDRAAGSLYDCLILLKEATDGKIDLSKNTKVGLMGDYLCRMNIGNDYFVNFADAGPKLTPHVDWFPYGLYLDNKELAGMSAFTAFRKNYFQQPASVFTSAYLYLLNRELTLLSNLSELKKYEGKNILPFDAWLPRVQVLTARSVRNSTEGLYLAAKGGHNSESHNHNDVGSFIVYADGQPLFIDPGVGTYRKETFNNKTRYKIWSMQSAYHNLPQINGIDQSYGKQYAAKNVKADIKNRKVTFTLDIADAYPDEAQVSSWTRNIEFIRNRQIRVTESYNLKKYEQPTTLMFVSQLKPLLEEGVVKYQVGENTYGIYFNTEELKPSVEEVTLDDKKFVNMWGQIYRLKLEISSRQQNGKVSYTIKKIK